VLLEMFGVSELMDVFGIASESISPYHHVRPGVGPTIIFHGTADTLVYHESVVLFKERMNARGNRCELISYRDVEHAFFNYGVEDNAPFIDTVNKMDAFLVSLGYLRGAPETVHSSQSSRHRGL